jgi:hypothetical protein
LTWCRRGRRRSLGGWCGRCRGRCGGRCRLSSRRLIRWRGRSRRATRRTRRHRGQPDDECPLVHRFPPALGSLAASRISRCGSLFVVYFAGY